MDSSNFSRDRRTGTPRDTDKSTTSKSRQLDDNCGVCTLELKGHIGDFVIIESNGLLSTSWGHEIVIISLTCLTFIVLMSHRFRTVSYRVQVLSSCLRTDGRDDTRLPSN